MRSISSSLLLLVKVCATEKKNCSATRKGPGRDRSAQDARYDALVTQANQGRMKKCSDEVGSKTGAETVLYSVRGRD